MATSKLCGAISLRHTILPSKSRAAMTGRAEDDVDALAVAGGRRRRVAAAQVGQLPRARRTIVSQSLLPSLASKHRT